MLLFIIIILFFFFLLFGLTGGGRVCFYAHARQSTAELRCRVPIRTRSIARAAGGPAASRVQVRVCVLVVSRVFVPPAAEMHTHTHTPSTP